MQQLITYCGQLDSYEKSNEVLKEMLQIEVSETQIYRVTDFYGKAVSATVNEEPVLSPVKADEVLYVQADGSMILTREESWSEVKVGRIFKSSDCLHAEGKPGWISHSQYTAYLGSHKEFTKTLDALIDKYGNLGDRLIFVSDGATWIRNWIEDAFPKAISILDYYHVCEHLHEFSSTIFSDKAKEKLWTDKQKEWLLKGEIETVISNIKRAGKNSESANQLISYYSKNKNRMKYQVIIKLKYPVRQCHLVKKKKFLKIRRPDYPVGMNYKLMKMPFIFFGYWKEPTISINFLFKFLIASFRFQLALFLSPT